jgi:single-stranded DNA-binding protein
MSIEAAFLGAITSAAEVKTSKAGKPYLRLNVRVENGEKALFINTMVFDPDAIAVADQMVKGSRVYVEGKLSQDEWTAQDGEKRHGLSVMSWHCRLSQIGSNKPRGETPRSEKPAPAASGRERAARSDYAPIGRTDDPISTGRPRSNDMDDPIPFAPEVR